MDDYIEIEFSIFYGFSFKYKVGFDLITYQMEDVTETLYCDPRIDNRTIRNVVKHRHGGLEHLVGKIMRWSCSSMTIIIPGE